MAQPSTEINTSPPEQLLAVAEQQAYHRPQFSPCVDIRLPSKDYWSDGVRCGFSYLRVLWEDGAYQYAYLDGYYGGRPSKALTREQAVERLEEERDG